MTRLLTEDSPYKVESLCGLFGVSKQAFYQHKDFCAKSLSPEPLILSFIQELRQLDPGLGGRKLWYLYRQSFQDPQPVGRDRFERIIARYNLQVRRPRRTTRTMNSRHPYPRYEDLTGKLLPHRPNQL